MKPDAKTTKSNAQRKAGVRSISRKAASAKGACSEEGYVQHIPKTATQLRVEEELAALDRAYKKVSASPETARAFLQSCGIIGSDGKLTKKYCS